MGHHPLHSSSCATWAYPWKCPECDSKVFVFQCTCGSWVMFDKLGDPWPKHDCFHERYGKLQAKVLPILEAGAKPATFKPFAHLAEEFGFEIVDFEEAQIPISKDGASPAPPPKPAEHIVKRMDPVAHEELSFVGVIRDKKRQTGRIKALYDALGNVGRKFFGLPPLARAVQLTIVEASGEPNESYSCVADSRQIGRDLEPGVMVHVTLVGEVVGSSSAWVVREIQAL